MLALFESTASGSNWQQRGQDIVRVAAFNLFGYSVALGADGNIVVGGTPSNDENGNGSGHV